MASSVWDQLRHSYSRIIDSSLKDIRDKGLLQEGGPDILDEIERRWRADLEAEVSKREGPRPKRDGFPLPSCGAVANVPAVSALGPRRAVVPMLQQAPVRALSFMNGVRFADGPPQLPTPLSGDQVPAMLQGIGLEASNVEGPPVAPKPKSVVPARAPVQKPKAKTTKILPPAKRMRRKSSPAPSVLEDAVAESPLPPPLLTDSDADIAGFSDADVGQANTDFAIVPGVADLPVWDPIAYPAIVPGAEDGNKSPGSELGSDLDDSEVSEPENENRLIAENIQLYKGKDRWRVLMQQGVIQIGGIECLLCTVHGSFDIEEEKKTIDTASDIAV